jgi:hypothetical protein
MKAESTEEKVKAEIGEGIDKGKTAEAKIKEWTKEEEGMC